MSHLSYECFRNVRVAERLALPTSDHGVAGSNPAGGEILPEPKRRFIAQSLSCSPFHRLEMTEILLKGLKTLTHPSIMNVFIALKGTHFLFFIFIGIKFYLRANVTGSNNASSAFYLIHSNIIVVHFGPFRSMRSTFSPVKF